MFFRNDDPGPIGEADIRSMHEALRLFNTTDEVRFGEDIRILAPILNTLTQTRKKFYLVHLPDGAGWVLRRHRPTGVYRGRDIPADALPEQPAEPAGEPSPVGPEPAGSDAQPVDEGGNRCYAEDVFGDRPAAVSGHAAAPAARGSGPD